jgi:hypothetical protein
VKTLKSFESINDLRQSFSHRLRLVDEVVQLGDLVLLFGILNHLK